MTVTLEVPVVFNAGDFWKKYPEDLSASKTVRFLDDRYPGNLRPVKPSGSWMTVTLGIYGQ